MYKDFDILSVFKKFYSLNKTEFHLYTLLSLAYPVEDVVLPKYYGDLTSKITNGEYNDIHQTLMVTLGLWTGVRVAYSFIDTIRSRLVPRLKSFIRENILDEYISRLSKEYSEPSIGKITVELMKIPSMVVNIFEDTISVYIPIMFVLFFSVFYMFYVSKEIGLLYLSFIGLILYTFHSYINKFKEMGKDVHNSESVMHEEISDLLSNLINIISSGNKEREMNNYKEFQRMYDEKVMDSYDEVNSLKKRLYFIYVLMVSSILGLCIKLRSKIGVSKITTIIFILNFVVKKISTMASEVKNFVYDLETIWQVNDSVNKIITNKRKSHSNSATLVESDNGSVLCSENLRVRGIEYPNFLLNKGDILLIKAENGKGKSTLIHTILGLRPYEGSVKFNGNEVSGVPNETIRSRVSYMPQTIKLFNRTVLENLLHGCDFVESEELNSLINKFGVNLGDLNKQVGNGGERLSGGQRQLLYMIRIILQNRDIIILDEPTSSLDTDNRKLIENMIEYLIDCGKTMIIISHNDIKFQRNKKVKLLVF